MKNTNREFNYAIKVILIEAIALPLLTWGFAGLCKCVNYAVNSLLIWQKFVPYVPYGFRNAWFLAAMSLPAAWLGWRLAKESDPPYGWLRRYWPFVAPMVVLLFFGIVKGFRTGNRSSAGSLEWFFAFVTCCVPFIISFSVSCAILNKPLEEACTKKRILANSLIVVIFVLIPLSFLIWQANQDADNKVSGRYEGFTVGEDDYLSLYWLDGENRLAKLDVATVLQIDDNYPSLDGATAFFPIYAAIAKEVYRADDQEAWRPQVSLSKTSEAYNRLIRGEIDVIFVLQPSDSQLWAAREAGVELRLTPIAKEAFVFFVSERNSVSNLSVEQIQNVYLKKITNWNQVGGDNRRILPFQRPEDSGSQTTMIKAVMNGQKLPDPLEVEFSRGMGGMVRGVAIYRDYAESIGYSFRFFTQEMVKYDRQDQITQRERERGMGSRNYAEVAEGRVKLLSVNGVAPTVENIANGTYPFTEDIYAVTAGSKNPHIQDLIDWILSPQGQELIEKTGYVRVVK
ncbi:MAG: substrate-binding domain-containing protein [Synergistaceae bacterium]|jgi:phosphate transport system substrate-binding protein|nr:substrate-binding domain-containing protein [Synergistaceae bacterium]